MKYLPCSKCHGYKKINFNKIKIDDIVYFYDGDNEIKLIKGIVTDRLNKFLYILTSNGTFWMEDRQVYPYDAPSQLTYNIFGTCFCNNEND
ncbi:hypothetical protein RFH07_11695 [Acinetobacter seifertii]|uniref:hypothetical protein n=1 Tax=Acinetobacter seifertii TaxID=1530123 RepID=UPI00280F4F7C|nr:hypothetical protein [Acinetobacter seifertii]MDQ9037263.1 hypothetical protein [Acinetobacter seifertii]